MTTGRTTATGSALDRVGLLLCVLSAAAFGSLAIFGKQAYAGGLGSSASWPSASDWLRH